MRAYRYRIRFWSDDQIKRIEYSDYAGIRYGHASKVINYVVVTVSYTHLTLPTI